MKRFILAVLAAIAVCAGLAAPASAGIHRVGPGPQYIKTNNANICVSVSPDAPNAPVVQGDYAEGHCRKMFFVLEGHINGFQYGEWETRGRNSMASANCVTVNLAPEHATGTVWVIYIQGNFIPQIVNRRCDGMHGHNDCREVLAANGNIGQVWNVVDKRLQSGYFVDMHIIQTSRVMLQATHHAIGWAGHHLSKVAQRVRAGC